MANIKKNMRVNNSIDATQTQLRAPLYILFLYDVSLRFIIKRKV